MHVESNPYNWPFDGNLNRDNTALLIIDMQHNSVDIGGMGYEGLRKPIPFIKDVLAIFRKFRLTVIHTRDGNFPNQATLPANKLWGSYQIGAGIRNSLEEGRSKILIQGEPNHDITSSELYPVDGEFIIDKPGKGSFYSTPLELILRTRGIRNLILTGITTDGCIHSTIREASDRGFECLLLENCCAATDEDNHNAGIRMIHMQGGVFGATTTSDKLIESFNNIFSEYLPEETPGHLILAVNGTLMRGLELNPNMIVAGATFISEAKTDAVYRMWSIDDCFPAMQKVTEGGVSLDLELWSVPLQSVSGILLKEPPGLCIGKVQLNDGREVLGVLGEAWKCEGKREITSFGGWRNYMQNK